MTAVVLASVAMSAPAGAAFSTLVWDATIADQSIATASASRPVRLGQADPTRLVVDLENTGSAPLTVRSVRLEGQVLGLTFFSYSTRVDVTLAPLESTQRQIDLDLDDLTTQAVGLLPARVRLVDNDRRTLADRSFPVRVQGSVASVYGVFGLAVLLVTLALLGWLLVLVWRRRLPHNRWARAVRFLPVGLGIGLTLTFSLSAFALLLPSASRWLPLVLVCGGAAFLAGYLMPLGREPRATDPEAAVETRVGSHV